MIAAALVIGGAVLMLTAPLPWWGLGPILVIAGAAWLIGEPR